MECRIEVIDGVTYYYLEYRGVEYSLYFVKTVGKWGVHSKRKALGRSNTGSFRYFDSLTDLESQLRAFRGFSSLIGSTDGQQKTEKNKKRY